MHLGATWIVNHIGASCVPAVTFSRTETFPFSNEPAWQTTLPRGSGNEQVVKLTLEKPSHSWWYFRFWLGFFHEILTFLDHPADRSELLGELCVICRKNKCYYSFVLQPSRGSALSIWIFALSHFGKKTHFLSSFSCYPLLFWAGAPDIFGHSVDSMNCSGKKFGEEIYSSWLTSTVGSFFCSTCCFVDNCLTPPWWTQGQHPPCTAQDLQGSKGKPCRGWCWNPKFL